MANKADETLTQIESQMNTLKEKASTSLESTSAKAREQIENLRTRAEKALTDTHSQATNRLTALIVQCTSILTNIQTTSKEAEKLHREQREEYGRIQAEALRLFNEYKTSWEKEEKNREVADEACKITQAIVTIHQRNPDQRFYSKQWLQLDLPKKIADIMDDGIKKGIDTEFTRRVNSDAEKKAQTRLKELQSGEWPRWLKTHVEPTAELLRSRIITNAIEALKGPWLSTCNKCNNETQVEFTPEQMENFLRTGQYFFPCPNQNCKDLLGRHMIRGTLSNLISCKLMSEPPPQ